LIPATQSSPSEAEFRMAKPISQLRAPIALLRGLKSLHMSKNRETMTPPGVVDYYC
jgi:hypothetical protein